VKFTSNDASFGQDRPKRCCSQFRAFFDEVALPMGLGHGHGKGDSMEYVKGAIRDSFHDDLDLPPCDPLHACPSLTTAAVEHHEFVARLGPQRRNRMVGLFGRQEIEALLQVRAVEPTRGHRRDYHR
jgi:hypothetical protein